jgi:hypothetical protein
MAFKVDDLLINVAADRGAPELRGECREAMISGNCTATPVLLVLFSPALCYIGGQTCPFSDWRAAEPISLPREMTMTLKNQLRLAIEELDRIESIDEPSEPQTVAEIEDLQGKLRKAIDSLDRRKERLKNK